MSDLSIELTAPNGRKYTQPTGLFINNEWVKSSNGQKLTSINPTLVLPPLIRLADAKSSLPPVTNPKSLPSTQPQRKTSMPPLPPLEKHSKTPHGATWCPLTEET